MLRLDKLTVKSQDVLQKAQDLVSEASHPALEDVHLLSALLDVPDTAVQPLVQKSDIDRSALESDIRAALAKYPTVTGNAQAQLAPITVTILEQAQTEAAQMGDSYTSCEHILLGILKTNSTAKTVLNGKGLHYKVVLTNLSKVRGSGNVDSPEPERK